MDSFGEIIQFELPIRKVFGLIKFSSHISKAVLAFCDPGFLLVLVGYATQWSLTACQWKNLEEFHAT